MGKGRVRTDVVVPMVFPEDWQWRREYRKYAIKAGRITESERIRSWGLERFFFRGLAKFMPWVGRVHLILAQESQVPEWLDRKAVHIVYHRDIIPSSMLPTYNSQTIEMFLDGIEGLSEQFIYANDDMIACSPLARTDFFHVGKPVIHCGEKIMTENNVFQVTVRNCMELAARDTDYIVPYGFLLKDGHSYAPMLRSVCTGMRARYGREMDASCTRFRTRCNLNQYLYTYRMWMTGLYEDGHHRNTYTDNKWSIARMQEAVRSGEAGVVCFNDAGGDCRMFAQAVYSELYTLFPTKCKYEI